MTRRSLFFGGAALLTAGCGGGGATPGVTRGQLLQSSMVGAVTNATQYKIDYATVDSRGLGITASALVAVPIPLPSSPRPMLCYFHGTTTQRSDVPSNPSSLEGSSVAELFGDYGYVVVAPDYPGLGDDSSGELQSFEQAAPLANMAIDAINAAQMFAARLGIGLSGKLFLGGFSEGGYATLAAQRAIEAHPAAIGFLTIVASAPISGAYDLSNTTLNFALSTPGPDTISFVAGLLLAYNPVYNLFATPGAAFASPYAAEIPNLFGGVQSIDQITAALPTKLSALLTTAFLGPIQSSPATNAVVAALAANDVYNWKNVAPIRLYHSPTDEEVPYRNAVVAQETLTANGGNATLVTIGGNADHVDTAVQAAPLIAAYFNSL